MKMMKNIRLIQIGDLIRIPTKTNLQPSVRTLLWTVVKIDCERATVVRKEGDKILSDEWSIPTAEIEFLNGEFYYCGVRE